MPANFFFALLALTGTLLYVFSSDAPGHSPTPWMYGVLLFLIGVIGLMASLLAERLKRKK